MTDFIERLISRTLNKTPDVIIKPAITPFMIPEVPTARSKHSRLPFPFFSPPSQELEVMSEHSLESSSLKEEEEPNVSKSFIETSQPVPLPPSQANITLSKIDGGGSSQGTSVPAFNTEINNLKSELKDQALMKEKMKASDQPTTKDRTRIEPEPKTTKQQINSANIIQTDVAPSKDNIIPEIRISDQNTETRDVIIPEPKDRKHAEHVEEKEESDQPTTKDRTRIEPEPKTTKQQINSAREMVEEITNDLSLAKQAQVVVDDVQKPSFTAVQTGSQYAKRPSDETIVTINIGRIEVHAEMSIKPSHHRRNIPVLSLKDYLKQRAGEDY